MNVDVAVVLVYLVATTLFGCSFYFRRGRDRADEFTKAGGRLPGWALALSVFATYVSSISFLALPAKAYLSNWNALVLSFSIPFAACAAAVWFVPFYRRQTSASAYSFLEARFGAWSRLYASGCFLVMQSVRSGMILYLLALVLNTLLGVDMPLVICVVGVATMLYSMMGGLHAVVWTDVVQSVVLIAGALLSLAVIAFTLPDGLCAGVSAAFDAGKLSLGDFSLRDWGSETFWVTFAYGVFLNLQNFGIDQTYTQRYVAAKSDREAVRSMFSGAMLYLPVSLVFVAIGTLLWAWVKSHPGMVPAEVLAKSDAVFPWFIIHRLPTGVSGLLVAAIIAAAMSTVSSTLNSGATVLLEDYAKRFSARAKGSEGAQVVFLRLATVGLGLLAVGVALAVMNVTSVLTTWWALQSVLSGGMLGLFLIGAFSRRTRSAQAAVATVVGVLAVAWVVFGARLLDLPQVLHVNLAMVVGTAALVLVGAFPVRRRVVALAAALLPLASSATIAVDVAKPPVKDPERDWTGVCFYGGTGKYEKWYSGGQGGKYPDSGGGPTWVAAASPDRSSVNLLVCNSSHAEWHQKFEFPGFRIAGKRRVRTYSCPAKYVQCHMIPGEPKPTWEEDYETAAEELTIKPYTIATVSCRLERPKAVVGILADASAGTRALTEKALCFFRDHGVDAILHTGGPDAAASADYAALRDGVFTNRPPREVFVGSACERLDLAGYPLVVAPDRPERTRYEELVAKAAADRTAGPVFVLQPRAAEGTAGTSASPGEGASYADGGSMRQFLDRFPGVVAVSGGRTSPRDVRSIWQGGFTALEAGGLGEYAEPYVGNQRNTATNREVVLMHVWDDRVDFTRHDVATGETTVPTWSVKLPHDPQNAAFGADKLASRCETGYFSKQCRKLTVRRNADDALEVGFQEACGKMDAVSFTWRYRVEVYDVSENDTGRLLARQDVRGAWDLPGRFGDWHKTTRPKAATFSAAVSSGWNRIRVVVTPESFAGELGEPIRQVIACPAAHGAWRRTWSGAPPTERRGNGWRCALDGSAFAGAPGDRYTVAFSLGVDADARAEVVNAAGVVKGGFAVAGLGADRPLRYAIEFAADEGDGELALVVSSASAKDAAVKNVSVHRLATHHYFGKVSDTAELEKTHPRLKKAFDFLRRKDLDTLACGTYELEAGAPGEKAAVFAMVQELDLKPAAPGPQRVEAHGRYIDVQAPRSAAETFGVAELDPTRPDFPFDAGKDIGFIDLPCELKTVKPGEFAVFMPPRGAHAPCLSLDGPRRIRKVVVKVLAD